MPWKHGNRNMIRRAIFQRDPSRAASKSATFIEAITNPEFVPVVIFCAIGVLVMLNVMLRVPALAAALN
jgi:hypothetical protein